MKIKCIKFECGICGKLSSIQVFYNKNGLATYARARHYTGQSNGKPQFEYHQQSLDYVRRKLCDMSIADSRVNVGQVGQQVNDDQVKPESGSERRLEPSAGFGPATITLPSKNSIDLIEFEKWVRAKYSPSYRSMVLCYVKKYHHLLQVDSNLSELELLTNDVKASVVKSLLLYSKFNGYYSQYKKRLAEYGIKLSRPDSLNAFLRILNASNTNTIQYYNEVTPLLRENERLFAKFLLNSGLRVSEGIASFNLIINLNSEGKLEEYFDDNLGCLMHFKYPKLFIRGTKNAFITFISKDFLAQIAESQPVTYFSIRRRLERNKKPMRFDEFRDYFGTHLVNNGILEIEQNLVCGRIPIGIFIRHYWSPKLKELGTRVLYTISKIETPTAN